MTKESVYTSGTSSPSPDYSVGDRGLFVVEYISSPLELYTKGGERVCSVVPYINPPLESSFKGGRSQDRFNWLETRVSIWSLASSVASPVLSVRYAEDSEGCAFMFSFPRFGAAVGVFPLSSKSGTTVCAGGYLAGRSACCAAAAY